MKVTRVKDGLSRRTARTVTANTRHGAMGRVSVMVPLRSPLADANSFCMRLG